VLLFDRPGKENTQKTLEIAFAKAKELETKLIVSTTGGDNAREALTMAESLGQTASLVVVGHAWDFKVSETGNKMAPDIYAALRERQVPVVFASHLLSGAERAFSTKFSGAYPAEIMAHTLRLFGQGMKVCVECSVMAFDAGCIEKPGPVVAVGGTGRGADTASVLTPAHANDILSTKIHEILCKPSLY
jgi:hypothetical protein